jgi:hypothetical protein
MVRDSILRRGLLYGKGNNGDEDIDLLERHFLCWLERIFGVIPQILRRLHQKVGSDSI